MTHTVDGSQWWLESLGSCHTRETSTLVLQSFGDEAGDESSLFAFLYLPSFSAFQIDNKTKREPELGREREKGVKRRRW